MPVTGQHMKVTIRYTYLAQRCENVQFYRLNGGAFTTATVLGVLEAYWNDIKTVLRAVGSTSAAVSSFDSILGEEVGGLGGFAEFAVPAGERAGTRAAGDDGEWLNSFTAVGARLSVATRATRPGQKRFPFLRESDVVGNDFAASLLTLYDPLFAKFSGVITLGAPVATGTMQPEVGKSVPSGFPIVYQDITGRVLNSSVTSQTSRKKGRGA